MSWLPIYKTKRLCPICRNPGRDWCMIAEDGTAVLCARVPNANGRQTKGGYYVHSLNGEELPPVQPTRMAKAPEPQARDWTGYVAAAIANVDSSELSFFAESLGLSVDSLDRLMIGRVGNLWTFPMSDGAGNLVGVRTRDSLGKKKAVYGSKNGLFIPIGNAGVDPLIVCEGPTDTAAALDAGVEAVGRASCNTGAEYLAVYCHGRSVAIIADRDKAGRDGAKFIAEQIRRAVRSIVIVNPPAKDTRAWHPTKTELLQMIDAQR